MSPTPQLDQHSKSPDPQKDEATAEALSSSSMNLKRVVRPQDVVIVGAPDANAYSDALKAITNAGLTVYGSDMHRKSIDVQGPIDTATLDTLVNQLGCTITPKTICSLPIYVTTMAIGEECQGWPPSQGGDRLTQAIPEEGSGRPGHNPGKVTTQALGEEGQAHP